MLSGTNNSNLHAGCCSCQITLRLPCNEVFLRTFGPGSAKAFQFFVALEYRVELGLEENLLSRDQYRDALQKLKVTGGLLLVPWLPFLEPLQHGKGNEQKIGKAEKKKLREEVRRSGLEQAVVNHFRVRKSRT